MNSQKDKTDDALFNFQVGDAFWGNIFKKKGDRVETTLMILKKVPLFQGMKNSALREFEKLMHRRRYEPDETIFFEGEPGVGMYIIEEGSVSIYREVEGSREELVRLERGEFFGELALLDDSPRSASAVALEETHVLGLFHPDLMGLIDRKPRLGNQFLFHLALLIGDRLKHTNEELQALWTKLEESKVIT